MKKLIIALFPILFLQSCIGSRYGSRKKGESTVAVLVPDKEVITYAMLKKPNDQQLYAMINNEGSKSRGALTASTSIRSLVSIAANGISSYIANQQKKYTSTYAFKLKDLYFYKNMSVIGANDPAGMQFQGFTLIRTLQNKHGKTDTAVSITFEVVDDNPYEILNNNYFRLRIKDIQVNYARAKVSARKQKLNMDFDIRFVTSYTTQSGAINNNVVFGNFNLALRDAPLNHSNPGYAKYYASLKGKVLDGQCFLPTRSYTYRLDEDNKVVPYYNQAGYSIQASVKESSKNTFTTEGFTSNSTLILNGIQKGVKEDVLTKKAKLE